MTVRRRALATALLAACGPDLARLETEEAALRSQVDVLQKEVDEMRLQMESLGLRNAGPAAGGQEVSSGASTLDAEIPVTITREGTPAPFPALDKPERRPNTECGYKVGVPWLEGLSDQRLEETGAGRVGPIQLLQDGAALEAHATTVKAEKTCSFAFRHAPRYLFFTPKNDPANVTGKWELALAPDLPMTIDGRPVYWVYPGTTLTVQFEAAWDAEQWGTPTVTLDARNVYTGQIDQPAATVGAASTVSFLGHESSSQEILFGVSEVVEPPDGPWTLEITSPTDGPYVLVHSLVVGNELHKRVAVAEGT